MRFTILEEIKSTLPKSLLLNMDNIVNWYVKAELQS